MVPDWPSVRDGLPVRVQARHLEVVRPNGDFRGTPKRDHPLCTGPLQGLDQGHGHPVTAEEDEAQVAQKAQALGLPGDVRLQLLQDLRGRVPEGDLGLQDFQELFARGRREVNGAPGCQGPKDVVAGQVKADGGGEEERILLCDVEGAVPRFRTGLRDLAPASLCIC